MTTIKYGDTAPTTWVAEGMDLTGCTVRFLARPRPRGAMIELPATITDPPAGAAEWSPAGELKVGVYDIELEVTGGALIATFPSDGFVTLAVAEDIR